MNKKVYILDDDILFTKTLSHFLNSNGIKDVSIFQKSKSLLSNKNEIPDIIILDHFLSNETGLNILDGILKIWPKTRVIYLSGQEKVNIALESIKKGAYAYVEKGANAYSKIVELIESENVESSYLY